MRFVARRARCAKTVLFMNYLVGLNILYRLNIFNPYCNKFTFLNQNRSEIGLFLFSLLTPIHMSSEERLFAIHLPQFEGPFDLLLFFIERDELDIHDIPIASITREFLEYIHAMTDLNIEVASEFILVAATLMKIKARMLLPRIEVDESGNEIDPRQDLVERLLIYKSFKETTEILSTREDERKMIERRGNVQQELAMMAADNSHAEELNNLTMFKLLTTFEKVMSQFKAEANKPVHKVVQYAYTIEGQRIFVRDLLTTKSEVPFVDILIQCKNRLHAIFTFLAILELLQEHLIKLILGEGMNNFWLCSN